ncbi:MAG: hypothetical protein AAGK93_00470 [Pseudomonadota bacterium]
MPLPDIQARPLTQNPGAVADTGEADAQLSLFSNLATQSRRFRQRLQPVLNEQAREQGARDVLEAAKDREDGSRAPEVPLKRAFSQQAHVYNQVVATGILANAKADYQTEVNRLRVEHEFDPEGFEAAAEQFIETYSEGLGDTAPDLLLALENEARGMFGAAGVRIAEQTRVRQVRETQDALQRRLGQVQAEITTLLEQDGAGAVLGDEYRSLEDEAVDIIDILADNPAYGWSDEQAAEAIDSLNNQSQEVVGIQMMEAEFHKNGPAAAMAFIDKTINAMTLDQGERIGARSRMQSELSILMQLEGMEEAERKAKVDAEHEELKGIVRNYEGNLLERMSLGEKPTAQDMTAMNLFVTAGVMTPSRMNTYVNAMLADDETPADQVFQASLFDFARTPGVTREDVEIATVDAIAAGNLSTSERETILREFDRANDDRFKTGQAVIDGMFSTGFMDIDTAEVKAQKVQAESELRDYFDRNPEATPSMLEQKARQLAVEYGRRVPAPPVPQIPNAETADFIDPQNIEMWARDARLSALQALDAQDYTPDEFTRAMDMIDRREAWQRDQIRLQQESVSAPTE